jgi:hypothetical protein
MNRQKKKQLTAVWSVTVIAIILVSVPVFSPYNDGVNGSWLMYVYETDQPLQDRELSVAIHVYIDNIDYSKEDTQFNDYIIYGDVDTVPLRDRFNIAGDAAYLAGGSGPNTGIEMVYMHEWHFEVAINEDGEGDFDNPENNMWYGEINLNQYVNRFTWRVYRNGLVNEIGYNYGIPVSHDGYTMELRFMYNP